MKNDTVYIAGPMRGYKDFNFPAFDTAAFKGRALGYTVISPADMDRSDTATKATNDAEATENSAVCARRDLDVILNSCSHIAMLPGWEDSDEAKAEYHVAKWIGLIILDAVTFDRYENRQLTPRQKLLTTHSELCAKALAVMKKKNHDYSGADGSDPFANFRRTEQMGICSTEQSFLVRLTDKLSRLSTFVSAGKLMVEDESVEDTIIDLINYPVLLAAYIRSRQ